MRIDELRNFRMFEIKVFVITLSKCFMHAKCEAKTAFNRFEESSIVNRIIFCDLRESIVCISWHSFHPKKRCVYLLVDFHQSRYSTQRHC